MGGSISRRFHRSKKNGAAGNGAQNGKGRVNRHLRDGEALVKGKYNDFSIGLAEAKSEEVEDALLKDLMRVQLAMDSQIFVINQLLLGVQFFANYDVDIEKSKDRVRTEQNIKSEKIRHCNKSVMMTNELSDAIDQNVIFQMRHGPQKSVKTNLFNHKLYIVHDNVEITNEGNDSTTYSSMNYQPSYRLEFDKRYKKRSGFVRLRFCDHVRINNPDIVEEVMSSDRNDSTENSNSSTSQTTSSLLYMGEDVKVIKDRGIYNSSQGSTSSDYDYTYLASFNEHRPLMMSSNYAGGGSATDPSILPEECITEIKRWIIVSTMDTSSQPSDNLEDKFQYMEQRGQYLNSKMFMNYFKRIFRDRISENLEIGTDQLMNATWKGASIYCPVLGSRGGSIVNHHEIIPAIACPWPEEAIDWFQRKRVLAAVPNAPQTWMTEEMINRIFDLNCHVIPIGYVSKKTQKSNNMSRSLEWKVIFPDAERYLESRLTDCQLKVFILAKILYKTYFETLNIPMSSKAANATSTSVSLPDLTAATAAEDGRSHFNFITDDHLRAHLFTQCELNTIKWSEFNLGGNLMEFLRTFLQRVQTKNLPDFFLPKRNLFENVPENVITRLHENIFRILENPVMYVMRALKNVKFVKNFYPKLNMARLYTILTIDEPLALVNPSLYNEHQLRKKIMDSDDDDEEEIVLENGANMNYPLGNMGEYHQKIQADPDKRRLTKQLKFQEMMKAKKQTANKKRESEDSINTEIVIADHMHKHRRKPTYEIFVRQFLEVGQKCLEFENHKFVSIYLRQARRLTDLLREDHFEIDAYDLQEKIRELEMLQKHPDVGRIKSAVQSAADKAKREKKRAPPPKKIEIWRPPISGPNSPTTGMHSPIAFLPMSPEMVGNRKSILKNGTTPPRSPTAAGTVHNGHSNGHLRPESHTLSIKADIHHHSSSAPMKTTISAKAPTSPIFRSPPSNDRQIITPATFNKTTTNGDSDKGSDYKQITTIELLGDKSTGGGGDGGHRRLNLTIDRHLDDLEEHVSVL